MRVLSRASRIRDPRATLGSSVLLFVAFVLFGVWAQSYTVPDAGVVSAAVESGQVFDVLRAACEDLNEILFRLIPRIE